MQSYDDDIGDDGNDNYDNTPFTSVYIPLIIPTLDNMVNLFDHVVDISLFVQHYPPLLFIFPCQLAHQLSLKYFRPAQCLFVMENEKQDIYGL